MYCCLLLQIYLCYLWLLLCSRDTFGLKERTITRAVSLTKEKNVICAGRSENAQHAENWTQRLQKLSLHVFLDRSMLYERRWNTQHDF